MVRVGSHSSSAEIFPLLQLPDTAFEHVHRSNRGGGLGLNRGRRGLAMQRCAPFGRQRPVDHVPHGSMGKGTLAPVANDQKSGASKVIIGPIGVFYC